MITNDDIKINAKFKTANGVIWCIDEFETSKDFGTLVRTSMEGGHKGNYRDTVSDVVTFLNEENAKPL